MKKLLHVGLSPVPDFHGVGLKNACDANNWEYKDIATADQDLNFQIINIANTYKPDLAFIQIQSEGLSKEAIEALKANNCFCINWSGDIRSRLPDFYFTYAQWGIDLTCFSNMQDVGIMHKCGYESDYLQIGASPEIFNTTGEINNCCEIAFCGNTFAQFPLAGMRKDMVRILKNAYGEKFKAFGSGQPNGHHSPNNQYGEAAIYRGAKIGINLSHFDAGRYTSDRLLKMLMCGTCVLSKWYPQIGEDFIHGEHLLVWKDFDELKQQINVILADPTVGRRIGLAGHKLAMDKFKFSDMGNEIINLYNKYSS